MKDKTVSVAKGVAIILMVLGHTGFNDFWGGVYLFVSYAALLLPKWLLL